MQINLSDRAVTLLLKVQAIDAWRTGNYSRISDRVDRLRYRVNDLVLTEIMKQIEEQQGQLKLTYNK